MSPFPIVMMMKPYINLPPPVEGFSKDVFIGAYLNGGNGQAAYPNSKTLFVDGSPLAQYEITNGIYYWYELEKIGSNYTVRLYDATYTTLLYEKSFNSNIYVDTIRFSNWTTTHNYSDIDEIYYNINGDEETKTFSVGDEFTSNGFFVEYSKYNSYITSGVWRSTSTDGSKTIRKNYNENMSNILIKVKYKPIYATWGAGSGLSIFNRNVFYYSIGHGNSNIGVYNINNEYIGYNSFAANTYYIAEMTYSGGEYVTLNLYNSSGNTLLFTTNHNVGYNIYNLRTNVSGPWGGTLTVDYIDYNITYNDSYNDTGVLNFNSFEEIEEKGFYFEGTNYTIGSGIFTKSPTGSAFFLKDRNNIKINSFNYKVRFSKNNGGGSHWGGIILKAF